MCLSNPHASNGQIGDIAVLRLLRPSSRPDDAHARIGAHLIGADPSLRCERARCQCTLLAVRLEGGRQRMGGGAAHGCRDQRRLRRCDGNARQRRAAGKQCSSAVERMCETGHGSHIPFVCTFSVSSHTQVRASAFAALAGGCVGSIAEAERSARVMLAAEMRRIVRSHWIQREEQNDPSSGATCCAGGLHQVG